MHGEMRNACSILLGKPFGFNGCVLDSKWNQLHKKRVMHRVLKGTVVTTFYCDRVEEVRHLYRH